MKSCKDMCMAKIFRLCDCGSIAYIDTRLNPTYDRRYCHEILMWQDTGQCGCTLVRQKPLRRGYGVSASNVAAPS
jgi:hypothetical protein